MSRKSDLPMTYYEKTIQQKLPEIKDCHHKFNDNKPNEESLEVFWCTDRAGDVKNLRVKRPMENHPLQKCVTDHFRKWHFQRPEKIEEFCASYTFLFRMRGPSSVEIDGHIQDFQLIAQ
jgi:hypothetical protein